MARTRARLLITVLALLATAGCYSTQPYEHDGRDHEATIVVYRQAALNLTALAVYVAVDDKVVATLRQDSYVEIKLSPGRHELRLNATQFPRGDSVTVDVQDLDWLYYEAEPNPSNAAAAVASSFDPTVIGVAVGALFMKPFLLRPASDEEFRAVVPGLERVEPERAGD